MSFGLGMVATSCGLVPPPAEEEGARCPRLRGKYAATFRLLETEGTCQGAKQESHDPLDFDPHGRYVSPVEGLVHCSTHQSECKVEVSCGSMALGNARARLDAVVSEDGNTLSGIGRVEGSYQGCVRVVYEVLAVRAEVSR
ncbi:MAG: hypothetical protein ACOZIN_02470 [Myxococcota bacterium]